ncbi:hypothetical protein AC1031_009783 [Aphanomyces cochlioides]|nr:hypothetical protein AC1031_009783 [Aphanomyces cochlioides]
METTGGDDRLSAKMKDDIVYSGVLQKRGHLRKNWLTRFFVLTSSSLRYFRRPRPRGGISRGWSTDSRYLRGELLLADIVQVEPDDRDARRPYRFTITVLRPRFLGIVQSVQYCIQAGSEDDRDKWLRYLKEPHVARILSKPTIASAPSSSSSAMDLFLHIITSDSASTSPCPSTAKILQEDFPVFLALVREMHASSSSDDIVRVLDQLVHEVEDGRYNETLKRVLAIAAELKLEKSPALWTRDVQGGYSTVMKAMYKSQPLYRASFKQLQPQEATTRYALGRILGSGAHSVVRVGFTAQHTQVAVKCIAKISLHPLTKQALLDEVAIMRSLQHPHLVPLVDFYETAAYYGVVTPLCTGGMLLTDLMHRSKYTEGDARRVMHQLTSALAYLHAHGIVHRDVKPDNILLYTSSPQSPILLADFGFAKRMSGEMKGTSCGTPSYMAPEVLLGHAYGSAVDCWALGVVLFILLSGKAPFPGKNHADICRRVVEANVNMDHPNWNNVSAAGKALVRALLVVSPQERLTAAQVLQDPWMLDTTEDGGNLDAALDSMRTLSVESMSLELNDEEVAMALDEELKVHDI